MERETCLRYLSSALAAAAVAAALLPAYIELFPMNFLLKEYPIWRNQLEFAATPSERDPELLVMGDSRVHAALIPELLGPDARSLALGGSTAIEAYFLLRRYLAVHLPPRALVLSFAPFHLERQDFFWERAVKWKALTLAECSEVFERSLALDEDALGHASLPRLLASWALYRGNFPPYYMAELENARIFLRRRANLQKAVEVGAAAGHTFYGRREASSELNVEARRDGFSPSPLLDAYLRDFLTLASSHDIAVTFAAMPMNRSSYEQLSGAFRAEYHSYLESLAGAHPEARVHTDLEFLPDDHFGDPSHLNPAGARRVSERYAALLREARPQ